MSRILQTGKMYRPTSMEISTDDNAVFVVEQYNHRISKWIYTDGLVDFKLDAGQVTSVVVVNGGTGYGISDPVIFSAPDLDIADPIQALGEVGGETLGMIDNITVTVPGNGYSVAPTIDATGSGNGDAVLTAVTSVPWGTNNNGTSGVPGKPINDTDNRLQFPTGIARHSSSSDLFVSDTLNHRIRVINKDTGDFEHSFGEPGTGDGQLYRPAHLSDNVGGGGPGDELAVADSRNHRVSLFDNESPFNFIGNDNPPPEGFHTPWGVKYSPPNQEFYYSDIVRGKVYQYDDDGMTFSSSFGTPGTDPSDPNQLFYPGASNGTPTDSTDSYLPDTRNNKVKIYNSSQVISDLISDAGTGDGELYWPESATGFANTGNDLLCVCNTLNNRIEVYQRGGTHDFLTSFGSP